MREWEEIKDDLQQFYKRRGGFRKIEKPDEPRPCISREHEPPGNIVLQPGDYEYECPACGKVTYIHVPEIWCKV